MTKQRNYDTLNVKSNVKIRIDELAEEFGGIDRASHNQVVAHLIEQAGYGDVYEVREWQKVLKLKKMIRSDLTI